MEIFRHGSAEVKAIQSLTPPRRKIAVDYLRRYYGLLFHSDITGSSDALLAKINADLDTLEKGKYKVPTETDTISDTGNYIQLLNQEIRYFKNKNKQLETELSKTQKQLELVSRINLSRRKVYTWDEIVFLSTLKCLRCGHEWMPNRSVKPEVCPKCKSPYWNKPKVKQSGPQRTTNP